MSIYAAEHRGSMRAAINPVLKRRGPGRRDRLTAMAAAVRTTFRRGEQGWAYEPWDLNETKLAWRRNQFLWSEDFTNAAWARGGVLSVTRKSDGVGDLLVPSTANSAHVISQAVCRLSAPNSVTVRAKAGGYNWLILGLAGGSKAAWFNLATGAVGQVVGTSASMVAVSGLPGYYDCTFTADGGVVNTALIYVGPSNGAAAFAGDGVNGIYLAQSSVNWDSVPAEYQKITDFNTEFLAAFPQHALFQDSNGTTPVTAIEQPVGLMLDKRLGGLQGPNLLPGFVVGGAGWVVSGADSTHIATFGNGTLRYQSDTASPVLDLQAVGVLTTGQYYAVEWQCISNATGAPLKLVSNGVEYNFATTVGSGRFVFRADSPNFVFLRNNINLDIVLGNFTMRACPGNHAYQTTAIDRPTFSARVNLLTKTEQLTHEASWLRNASGTGVLPVVTDNYNGVVGESRIQLDIGAGSTLSDTSALEHNTGSIAVGPPGTLQFQVKAQSPAEVGKLIAIRHVGAANYFGVTLTADWQTVENTVASATNVAYMAFTLRGGAIGFVGCAQAADFLVRRIQLESGAVATPYQRVNTSTDYDSVGFPKYLKTNGTNQCMRTASIDLTGSDKITVVTAIRHSDGAGQFAWELSSNSDAVSGASGTAYLYVSSGANGQLFYGRRGAGDMQFTHTTSIVTPRSIVTAYSADLASTPEVTAQRINGTTDILGGSASADSGVGPFGNNPLFLFSRNASNFFLNGHFYGSVANARSTGVSAQELALFERYVNQNTRITLA